MGTWSRNLTWEAARQEEQRFFESYLWNAVPTDRKGRDAVKKFLGNVLFEHISRELSILKREVDATIDTFKKDLAVLGTPIASTTVARGKLHEAAMRLQPQLIAFLNADYDHAYLAAHKDKPIPTSGEDVYFIRSSLLGLYKKYCSDMSSKVAGFHPSEIEGLVARYEGNNLSGLVDYLTFKSIVNGHFLNNWRVITKTHVEAMHSHLYDALSHFIAYKANSTARDVFTHVFGRFSRLQGIEVKKTIESIIDGEAYPLTLSRHYSEAIHKARSKNNRLPALPRDPSVTDLSNSAGLLMTDWDDVLAADEMIPCLRAYLKTARERIFDKVLMETIEHHMVKGMWGS
ncbi:hypothetical protein BG015_005551 [Linnemannia schmuckeri]|uniref:Dynamin stalk domain-containing protein n=1 Tax=Linnemannia schmuckeri TaxID=64567 RepID=A0A9P5UWN7_9FUNG|nr:hypothetical protein BG015_005551 [Linnemannia schmuckeri]